MVAKEYSRRINTSMQLPAAVADPQYIDYPDLARVANMVYTAALEIANMPARPKLDAPKPPLNRPCVQ
jgi:hypothetical protein